MNSQHGQEDVPALWSVIDVGNAYSNELPDIFPDGQCWMPLEAHEQDNPYQAPQSIDNWVASCAAPSEQPPLSGDGVGVRDDAFPKFDGLSCQFLNSPNDMTHENSSYTSLGLPQYHVPGGVDGAWPHQPSFPSPGAPDDANEPLDIQFSRPFFSGPQPSLPRRRSRYFRSHGSVGRPVSIPTVPTPSSSMDPLQRWRDSPPETEPASLSAIADALQRSPVQQDTRSRSLGRTPASSVSLNSWTTCSSSSVSSSRSSKSNSFLGPVSSSMGRVRKTRRNKPGANDLRRFPCTFCCDAFKTKYDWARHEKSLHLDLDQWVCAPDGGSIVLPTTGRNHCAYCNMLDPTDDHLGSHNHHACHAGQEPRAFRRKDHLVQHLRVFHRLEALPIIDHWKIEPPAIVSRCGFCDEKLTTWQIRADHLSDHFRKGLTMRDWKGGNGFDPFVAAQVRNAIPPYTLAAEAKTLVPFSATDPRTTDHLSQILEKHALTNASQSEDAEGESAGLPLLELSPTTYASFLALHLGRFAQRNISQGIFPDDQMFQDEARRLVYGSADGWEHTIADNNEWMSAFRTQHEIPE